MDANTAFLKSKFREYYLKNDILLPPRFTKREYGFMFFDKKFVLRHKSFKRSSEIKRFLVENVPKHAYYSTAYYKAPDVQDMEEKGWLGADLIFDLDADHIPETGGKNYEDMLKIVKKEAEKLIFDFLMGDMGFKENDLFIAFSGGRGYHIYVRNPEVWELDSDNRREIVNYITGEGVDIYKFFRVEEIKTGRRKRRKIYYLYPLNYGGWYSKVHAEIIRESRYLLEIYNSFGENELIKKINEVLEDKKLSKKLVRELLSENKEYTTKLEHLANSEESQKLQIFKNDALRDLFLIYIKNKIRIKGEVDEPVTTDIHRLIRLIGSLHGKTGFLVRPLTLKEFKYFNPLRDAIPEVFKNENTKIKIKNTLKIELNGEKYELQGEDCVPDYVAIFAIARGLADFIARC